jgi:hypothetical protein
MGRGSAIKPPIFSTKIARDASRRNDAVRPELAASGRLDRTGPS